MVRIVEDDPVNRVQCDQCGALLEYRASEIRWITTFPRVYFQKDAYSVRKGYIRCPNHQSTHDVRVA